MLDRVSVRDLALLFEAHHIRAVDDLLRDLARVGETKEIVVQWLGHPLAEISAEEERTLGQYVKDAEKALRDNKATPYLPPNTPLLRQV